ncbi:MAG: hypothetical protein ACRD8U_23425 [Pyrinomonadaceae bacterium]
MAEKGRTTGGRWAGFRARHGFRPAGGYQREGEFAIALSAMERCQHNF